jgi:hypothetical protein
MLQSEFEERVGFTVTSDCYHECIEPEYDASKLEKDEWCKQWKKDHGIQRAYSWMAKRVEELEKSIKEMSQVSEDNIAKQLEIERLRAENDMISNCLDARNKQLSDLNIFMIEQSNAYGSSELRAKVIKLMGAKEYLRYKLANNLSLWEADRNMLIDIID